MKARGLIHIAVALEAHMMRKNMKDLMLEDQVLAEEVMTEILSITMMKEEVLDFREKIRDREVTGKVLFNLRLLMTGSGMRDLETAGSHLEIPSYQTETEIWIVLVLAPLLHVLLKRY